MSNYFIPIQNTENQLIIPETFNYPFNYHPHPIAQFAAEKLKLRILELKLNEHDFDEEVGKMFGVLVVTNDKNELGYLAAFSGKLGGGNHFKGFVPPVFDTLDENGFYRIGEDKISAINKEILELESSEYVSKLNLEIENHKILMENQLNDLKKEMALAKQNRKGQRQNSPTDEALLNKLNKESAIWHYRYKDTNKNLRAILDSLNELLQPHLDKVNQLKELRKSMSNELQNQLFAQYAFLDYNGQNHTLRDIFLKYDIQVPPSGAGECAAPKLLQFAYQNKMKPIALAEFWWGKSPSSEIRKHGEYYPACRGKCEPILGHMIQGLAVDPNPMLARKTAEIPFDIMYEDDEILVINKPPNFLSVPGKKIQDSVYTRVKALYPYATGPLIVHRLDMSTSGLLVIAKTKYVHQNLQSQFTKRKVSKRYIAILEGVLQTSEGTIDLPLRVDLENRPHQLVCYEHGKHAITHWKVIEVKDKKTRIHFFPVTGRTHQLRVHAAHHLGLNMAIEGDDLYGHRAERLMLHAEYIQFWHPVKEKLIDVVAPAPF
ncbi:MAG TPA: pseudouridine synthase [Saprospiraceae bacterium]|nr:pseudouridine synthase [Saprospiraceae bacterium]HPN69694.1 pseudouridine synthase [Saprospiraceae bacterium]